MKNITDITEPVAHTKIIPNECYALEGQTVCIIRMFDVALALSLKNRVLYITDDEKQYNRFKKFVVNNKAFGDDDNVLLVKNSNENYLNQKLYDNMEKFLQMNGKKKFDCIIGNPPYAGKGHPLYLRILEQVKTMSNDVVWLCPSQWVKNYKDSDYVTDIKNRVCADLVSHQFVGNPFEKAGMLNEVGIFHFSKADKYENYESIRLERFSNPSIAKSIWDKFESYSKKENIDNHNKIDLNKKYYVRAQWIRGNVHGSTPCWDWTTLFGEDQRKDFSFKPKNDKSSPTSFWNFDTDEECKNFIASTETDILMFAHFISKINNANNNQVLKLIPWFGDYTHEWTEDMIQKELGLTDEEVTYIHEEMKDFGWKTRK